MQLIMVLKQRFFNKKFLPPGFTPSFDLNKNVLMSFTRGLKWKGEAIDSVLVADESKSIALQNLSDWKITEDCLVIFEPSTLWFCIS